MPSVTLSDVLRAAKGRCVVLSAETAGYAVLALADEAIRSPVRAVVDEIELSADGSMWFRHGCRCDEEEAARSLRGLLAQLLSVAPGGGASLCAAARPRQRKEGIGRVVGEIEAALIPVNRAAARRALARLCRETQRAKDQGRLSEIAPPAAIEVQASPSRDRQELVLPGGEKAVEPLELELSPVPSLPLPPVVLEQTERIAGMETMDQPDVGVPVEPSSVEGMFVPAQAEEMVLPEASIDIAEANRTPFLGTVVTATRHVPSDAATAEKARASFVVASLVRTPPWPSGSAAIESKPCALAQESITPPRPWAETPDRAPAAYEPRRSDVIELLEGFVVEENRPDSEWLELKRSIGLDPTPPPPDTTSRTPPPVAMEGESRTSNAAAPPLPRRRSRRYVGGALTLAVALTGLELRPSAASRAPAIEACRAELDLRNMSPGSELRVRSAEGVEIRRARADARGTSVVSMLPCRGSLELLVAEQRDAADAKWVRIGVDASQLTPEAGQSQVRRTISVH